MTSSTHGAVDFSIGLKIKRGRKVLQVGTTKFLSRSQCKHHDILGSTSLTSPPSRWSWHPPALHAPPPPQPLNLPLTFPSHSPFHFHQTPERLRSQKNPSHKTPKSALTPLSPMIRALSMRTRKAALNYSLVSTKQPEGRSA